MTRLVRIPLALLLYPFAAFSLWVAGRLYRHLEDPDLVARLRQLNTARAELDDTWAVDAELRRVSAQWDYVARDLKAAGQ